MTPIRVLVVDDQELVRTGLRMILDAQDDLEVVGEAAGGEEAVREGRHLRPDVVLMDIRMPGMDGLEATRQLLATPLLDSRVLMLTTFDHDENVHAALRAGASGFLLKDGPAAALIDAIRTVAAGESLLAPSVTTRLIAEFVRRPTGPAAPPPELAELTAREAEVLGLLAQGLSNAEIAERLIVGDATIKTHVARILMKLGLRDRTQAVIYAYEHGIVQIGSWPGEGAQR